MCEQWLPKLSLCLLTGPALPALLGNGHSRDCQAIALFISGLVLLADLLHVLQTDGFVFL